MKESTFKYKGVDVIFCGFYQGQLGDEFIEETRFVFYAQGKVQFIKSIDELDIKPKE